MTADWIAPVGIGLIAVLGLWFVVRRWGVMGGGLGGQTAKPKVTVPPVKASGTGAVTAPLSRRKKDV